MTELTKAKENFLLAHEEYLNAVFIGLPPGDIALRAESVAKAAHLWDLETRASLDGVVDPLIRAMDAFRPTQTRLAASFAAHSEKSVDWPESNDPEFPTKLKAKCEAEALRLGITIEDYTDRLACKLIFEHGISPVRPSDTLCDPAHGDAGKPKTL